MIKVSVIVPVFNVEEYLRECLDSLVGQTLSDIEIIIVSDGPDNCNKICEEYVERDSRIRLIKNSQNNKSLALARNIGLKYAAGKYISFVDADDIIENDFLQILYDRAEQFNADVVFSNSFYLCGNDIIKQNYIQKQAFKINKEVTTDFRDKKVLSGSVVVWNKLYRHSLLSTNNILFVNTKTEEDVSFNLKALFMADRITFAKDAVYYYRIRNNSLKHDKQNIKSKLNDIIAGYESVVEFFHCIQNKQNLNEGIFQFIKSYYVNQIYVWRKKISKIFMEDYDKKSRYFLNSIDINIDLLDRKTKRRYKKLMENCFLKKFLNLCGEGK